MAYTEAQKKASIKYKKEKTKRIPLDVTLEQYEKIKEYANKQNTGVNTLIKKLLLEEIEKDQ